MKKVISSGWGADISLSLRRFKPTAANVFTGPVVVLFDLSSPGYNSLHKVLLNNSGQELSPKLHKKEHLLSTYKNSLLD